MAEQHNKQFLGFPFEVATVPEAVCPYRVAGCIAAIREDWHRSSTAWRSCSIWDAATVSWFRFLLEPIALLGFDIRVSPASILPDVYCCGIRNNEVGTRV